MAWTIWYQVLTGCNQDWCLVRSNWPANVSWKWSPAVWQNRRFKTSWYEEVYSERPNQYQTAVEGFPPTHPWEADTGCHGSILGWIPAVSSVQCVGSLTGTMSLTRCWLLLTEPELVLTRRDLGASFASTRLMCNQHWWWPEPLGLQWISVAGITVGLPCSPTTTATTSAGSFAADLLMRTSTWWQHWFSTWYIRYKVLDVCGA